MRTVILAIFLAATGFTQAQELEDSSLSVEIPPMLQAADMTPMEVNLEAAILMSLERNHAVHLEAAVVDLREGQLQSATGEFDWFTFSSFEVSRERSPTVTIFGNSDTLVEESLEYVVGVTRKLRNGISVTPTVGVTTETTRESVPEAVAASSLNLEVMIPLLRGLGEASARASESSAEVDLEAARLAYQQVLSDQGLSTLTAYWRCAAALMQVEILEEIEKRAADLITTTQSMIDAELLSSGVMPQARANFNDQRSQYLAARSDYASARYRLALTLGLEPEEMVNIPRPLKTIPELDENRDYQLRGEPYQFIRLAMNERADLRSAEFTLQARDILLTAAEKDLKPQLDFTISTGYTGGSFENKPLDVIDDNLRGANLSAKLGLEWPVNNDFRKGILRQRRAALDRADYLMMQLRQSIASRTLESVEIVNLSAVRALIAQDSVRQYQKAVELVTQRLSIGDATVFEVIDMEGRYARSLSERINALRDYYIAVGRLRFESGTFFEPMTADGAIKLAPLTEPNILNSN